jgi:PAS domain S-box-containing protein
VLAPLAVLASSLLLTGAVTSFFLLTARERDSSRFESLVRLTHDRISAHLDSDITLLRGAAGLFAASSDVTAEEFNIYVERLDLARHDPGVLGIGFSERIPSGQQEAWLARRREQGQPAFQLWPAAPREEYHAIIHLEPPSPSNRVALGYNMFTDAVRREAMERAWRTGAPALSGKVLLSREDGATEQAGFLLYVPVYQGGKVPGTEEERLRKLQGFVFSSFQAVHLFHGIFHPEPQTRISFLVFDGTEPRPEHLLYDSALGEEEHPGTPAFSSSLPLEVAGQRWTLVFFSRPSLEQTLLAPWAPAVAAVGLLFSLMVSVIAWTQVSARQRAESSEAERTRLLARERAAHAEAEAQRTYLHDLFMHAPAAIAILEGPRMVFEFANDAYRKALGYRPLNGRPFHEAVPDVPPELLENFESVYRTGEPRFGQEVRILITYDQGQPEERFWNIVWQPRRTPTGAVTGVLQFAFEVTEQVRARRQVETSREEARRSAAQLRTITDALPALVAYVDTEERYLFANQTYERWFGIKPEQIVGQTAESLVGAQSYEQAKEHIRRALAGETVRYEFELALKEGPTLYVQSNYIPDRDEQGRVRGFVALAHDFTERKKAEEAVRNAVRLRDEFLSVASHELKTPLTPLSLKLQTLAREVDAQPGSPFVLKVRAHVEAGRRQIKRLADLIGDLLDVSRITSGQLKLRWEPVDFAAVTREVITRLEPEATRAECSLTVEAPGQVVVSSDRMRLEQVLENLMTNAIKYGAGKPIHVQLVEQPSRVVLIVRDQGIGIAPENQARIFERFERAVSERNYGGLGLGLYITRTIVEALGGTIRVESQPAQGAVFTVELPREPVVP